MANSHDPLDSGRVLSSNPNPQPFTDWRMTIGRTSHPIQFSATELLKLEISEKMFDMTPMITLLVALTSDYAELETLEKDDVITLEFSNSTEFERGTIDKAESVTKLRFQVKDYRHTYDRTLNQATYGIYGLVTYSNLSPSASSAFYESNKHRFFHGPTSEVIKDVYESHGIPCVSDVASNDIQPCGWVQLSEPSNNFVMRMAGHSFIAENDLLLTWVGIDGVARISSLNKLYESVHRWSFKQEHDLRGEGVILSREEIFRRMLSGSNSNTIPAFGFEYNRQMAFSKANGVGGTDAYQTDPLNSRMAPIGKEKSYTKIGETVPWKQKDSPNNLAMPYLLSEWGIAYEGHFLPAKSTNVSDEYWPSRTRNHGAVALLTSNCVSFQVASTGQYRIGDLFDIDHSISQRTSNYSRNNVFVIYAMTHHKNFDDQVMMTKIWGVSPYITLGKTDTVSMETNLTRLS